LKPLPVHERFFTWQGEGIHLGRSAYFIRTFGCPVKCPWCDSAGTWHPDHTPKNVEKAEVEDLVSSVIASKCEFVVITGGEPTIHDLSPLTSALHQEKIPVHVETCGAFPFRGDFDWVTLSPKWWKLPLEENISKASEFKIIVEDESSIEKWSQQFPLADFDVPVWLHPEWSALNDQANPQRKKMVLSSISNWVKEHGAPFRAGYQLHKLYDVDRLDPNSRELVPLGGDPNNGY
jgi:7-carboxy-7-deazaguanine synthase